MAFSPAFDLDHDLGLIAGIILTVLGSALMAIGSAFMKLGLHLGCEKERRIVNYPCSEPTWWGGLAGYTFGAALHVVALGFAPASILAPMNSMGLIANAISAWIVLQEPLGWIETLSTFGTMFGVFLCALASFFQETTASHGSDAANTICLASWNSAWYISYMILGVVCAIGALTYLISADNAEAYQGYEARHSSTNDKEMDLLKPPDFLSNESPLKSSAAGGLPIMKFPKGIGLSYGFLAGLIGAQCVLELKEIVICLQHPLKDTMSMWSRFEIYSILTFLFASVWLQIHYLNLGLGRGDATLVVPTYYVIWTFFGTLGGFAKFNEYEGYGVPAITLFITGFLITVLFIAILAVQEIAFLRRFVNKHVPEISEAMDLTTQDLLDHQLGKQVTLGMGLFPFSMIVRTVGRERYQTVTQKIRRTRSTASETALEDEPFRLSVGGNSFNSVQTVPHDLRLSRSQAQPLSNRRSPLTHPNSHYYPLRDGNSSHQQKLSTPIVAKNARQN